MAENIISNAGNTSNTNGICTTSPATMAIANGCNISDPAPIPSAKGINARMAAILSSVCVSHKPINTAATADKVVSIIESAT